MKCSLSVSVPKVRISEQTRGGEVQEVNSEGDYVVYWMVSARRTSWNFGLQRAVEWAETLNKPLLVFEALRSTYEWNSDRFHAFIIQ
ncbi:MAG: deoxyribodipyrimidine photo-lyase, partial [Mariniblastus sp.]